MTTAQREQQASEVVEKLYTSRDTAQFLLGDKYDAKVAHYMSMIRKVASSTNRGLLSVATELLKHCAEAHDSAGMLLTNSAIIELHERGEKLA